LAFAFEFAFAVRVFVDRGDGVARWTLMAGAAALEDDGGV
jgi:hypothetical protein